MSTLEFHNASGNLAILKSEHLEIIRDRLSVKDAAARYIKKKNPYYPDRKYMMTKSGKFECGLIFEVIRAMTELELPVNPTIDPDLKKKVKPSYVTDELPELAKLSLAPYDYQSECVERMLRYGRGTILIGTGGGKTLIMSLLIKTLLEHINPKGIFLVIVPTLQLVEQTYNDMVGYGIDPNLISKWSGNNQFSKTKIIIAGVDILQSGCSDLGFLSDVGLLLVDEVHVAKKGNLVNNIIKKVPTPNRFGFTGTLPENPIDQWNIFGTIGGILYTEKSKSLRDKGVISPVKVNIIRIEYNNNTLLNLHDNRDPSKTPYQAEVDFYVSNPFRNNFISKIANKTTGNTLVMVDRIAHGEGLEELIKNSSDKDVYFIQGAVDVEQREQIRGLMENNSNIICIAISSIFSTGINIKNIHNIIFCTPGKAKVKIIQSIGRGLRLHATKTKLIVYDITDELKYSSRHLEERLKLYDQESIQYEQRNYRQPTD